MPTIMAGGHRLEYLLIGPPAHAAPTLVFLHEGLGSISLWRDFPARLAEATGCGALVFERWGHGQSDPLTSPRPVTFMHEEAWKALPELLIGLEVSRPILVGHSDGGSIALLYASRAGAGSDGTSSEGVSRAGAGSDGASSGGVSAGGVSSGGVSSDGVSSGGVSRAGAGPDSAGPDRASSEGSTSGSSFGPAPLALLLLAPHVFVEDLTVSSIQEAGERFQTTDLPAKLARHHGANTIAMFRGWHDIWVHPDFRSWNIEACLPAITCPVLVVQGREDEYGTPRQLEALAAGLSGPLETLLLPDCGHSPHRQQPDATLEAMTAFLTRLREGPQRG